MNEPSCEFDPVDNLAQEFLERYRRGERPSLTEYTGKYPELAERICTVFPALVAMEEVGRGGGQATGPHVAPSDSGTPTPQRLGDYLLLRRVGAGGMGVVYEAIQESLGRHVALKTLPSHHLGDVTRLERFRREARAAARLHHTHIVPVFGVGEHEGLHYYTMQFIRGHGLDAVLREVKRLRRDPSLSTATEAQDGDVSSIVLASCLRTGRFPANRAEPPETTTLATGAPRTNPVPAAAPFATSPSSSSGERTDLSDQPEAEYLRSVARIGVQVAEALEYAHQQGILHRDIKPSNLLLDAQGEVWVTDFGLAKARDSDELTRTGDIVGTLRYMAPERFNGWSDARSDVYALGATMYEMLTLRPAFDESDRIKLIEQVVHDSPPSIRQLDRRIPRDLETIVLKALAKEPGERYATAGQMAEDLRRFGAGRPILARRSSAIERLWRFSKRNPLVAGAVGAVAAALVAVAVISVIYATDQAHATTRIGNLADELRKKGNRLTTSLAESNRLLAIRNFDRGQAAFEKDQIGPGLLWMVESWKAADAAGDPDWQHAARANLAAWRPHHARLKAVLSHEGPVAAAAFSPDGKFVLTGGDDRTARLWDAATGQSIGSPFPDGGEVIAVAYSPDGRTILTGSADNTARLWDAATHRPIGQPLVHQKIVGSVAFSPDGKFLVTASWEAARLWDAATRRPIGQPFLHQNSVCLVTPSPDGKSLLTGSEDRTARLWNIATGQPIGLPLQHRMTVGAAAFSPDSKSVFTGCWDGTAQWWNAATGKPVGEPIRHREKVRAVAISPDGRTVLTGSEDKTAQLWDAVTNQPIGRPLVHQGPVVAVAFSPDGKSFLTASSDNTAKLWDADPGQPFGLIAEREDVGFSVAYSPDGKSIVTGHNVGTAKHWDATTGQIIGQSMHHQAPVLAVAVSPDGTRLLTGSEDETARLWDTVTGKPIGQPLQHGNHVHVVAFSPDGKTIVTGSEDRMVRIWDAFTGAPLGQPILQSHSVEGGAISPDGTSFVAGCANGSAQLWDLANRTPLGQPFPHPGCISAAAFSPDGKTLLTGCEDGAARLWDLGTRKLRTAPLLHQLWIFAVAFSPDGKTVFTGSKDKTARLWDAATGMPLGPPIPHPLFVFTAAFSPDGNEFLTGAHDQAARLFRKVPELPDDLDRVATWVEVLTGLTLDAGHGTIQALDNAAWRKRREQLEQRGGPPETGDGPRLDPILFGTDSMARGRALMEREQWDEAEAAFDELVQARPYNASSWIARGEFYSTRGQQEKACADFGSGLEKNRDDPQLHYRVANGELLAGDLTGYRNTCAGMLKRFNASDAPYVANRVAYACIYAPDAVVDMPSLIRVAEKSIPSLAGGERTVGAVRYRAGRYEEALKDFERSHKVFKPRAWDSLFLAMIHGRLGHLDEARRMLAEVRHWIAAADGASGNNASGWNYEYEKPQILLLLREAEALILYDPIFPRDPFAH